MIVLFSPQVSADVDSQAQSDECWACSRAEMEGMREQERERGDETKTKTEGNRERAC